LSKDSLWTVRKAVAEQLHKISSLCEESLRSTILIDVFMRFCLDSQRFVKIVVIENFGYFIDTMEKTKLNMKLLEFYIQLITEYYNPSQKKVYNSDIDVNIFYFINVINFIINR